MTNTIEQITKIIEEFLSKVHEAKKNGTFDKDDVYDQLYSEGEEIIGSLDTIDSEQISRTQLKIIHMYIDEINDCFSQCIGQ